MRRLIAATVGFTLVLLAVAFVLRDAWAWQRAADIVDLGFRKLATATPNERPGAIFLESDSYYWLSYARRIAGGESWRIRETANDNTPYGRPVHWSQSISWLIVAFGKVRQSFSGENLPTALERGSIWINPLLLIGLVSVLGVALWRRIGPIPFGLFAVYLVTLGDVGWEFQALRPDHQSLQALFGILLLAGLVIGGAGWVRVHRASDRDPWFLARPLEIPQLPEAKRWFVLSGVCAAFSLWISAVVAIMLLMMLFGAGLLLAFGAPPLSKQDEVQVKPELWRLWGVIAGIGSFGFYLLEYFPNHLGFRLEINGPLYSLAVAAMGEGLCQFMRARYAEAGRAQEAFWKGIVCVLLVALVPLAIYLGPASWHALKDPEMRRLHGFIQEFYSFPRFAGPRLNAIIISNFGILPLFFILAIGLAAFARLRVLEWAVVWLSFAVALGMLALGYLQVRWLGLYVAMNTWLALITGVCAWRLLKERIPERARWFAGLVVVVALLVQPIRFAARSIGQVNDIIAQRTVPKELANPVLNKRLALALRHEEGEGTRVMADPDFVPALQYFGEGTGVVAFYWEDIDGLHAATAFFADTNGEVARKIAAERGLTHVVVQEGNRLQTYFYYIATGKIDQAAAAKILAARLVGSELELPFWLQTTPMLQQVGTQLYTYGGMRFEERWRIYRISR